MYGLEPTKTFITILRYDGYQTPVLFWIAELTGRKTVFI